MARSIAAKRCDSCGHAIVTPHQYFSIGERYLTFREFTIFTELANGLNKREAARKLGLSSSAVWNTLQNAADRWCVVHWSFVLEQFKSARRVNE